jgi:cob(II)yrinic acid a,c-diamide reductase
MSVNLPIADNGTVADSFVMAMREFAATVTVITSSLNGKRSGLTATAVCSLSNDPPSLIACVNRETNTHPIIQQSRRFCINLLIEDQQRVAEIFAGPSGVDGEEKFTDAGQWVEGVLGLPILSDGLANIICDLTDTVDVKTHSIFVGHVKDVVFPRQGKPLMYANHNFATTLTREV